MPETQNLDIRLLRSLQQGDSRAFEAVFRRYNGRVYGFVLASLHDRDVAEDITQSVFMSVWEHRASIDPERNFQGWLFTIARNMVYRHTENLVRNHRFEEYIRRSFNEKSSATEEGIDAGMLEELIMRLVERLPEARRRIFTMSFREQLTNREIAEELAVSTKTVETQLRRSLDFLRKNLHSCIGVIALIHFNLP